MPEHAVPTTDEIDALLSADLGFDVQVIESQARFQLDQLRMKKGETPELGYIVIERENHPDAVLVFADADAAKAALNEHELVDQLAAEDSLDVSIPDTMTAAGLVGREIILVD